MAYISINDFLRLQICIFFLILRFILNLKYSPTTKTRRQNLLKNLGLISYLLNNFLKLSIKLNSYSFY